MWCMKCGMELPTEARFCFSCGNPVPTELIEKKEEIQEEQSQEEIQYECEENPEEFKEKVRQMRCFQVEIFGKKLEYLNEISVHANIERLYSDLVNNATNEFLSKYEKVYKDLSGVIDYSEDDINKYLIKGIEIAVEKVDILLKGDYDKNAIIELFKNECGEFGSRIYDLSNIYNEVMDALEEEKSLRAERKAYRGRWQGGGFGVGGAIKGATMAGAMNMGSGLMHSIANGIGNSNSNYKANSALDEIYKNEEIKEKLVEAIEIDLTSIKDTLIELVEEFFNIEFHKDMFDINNLNRSIDIYNKLSNDEVKEDELEEYIINLLTAYPLDEDYYYMAIKKYGKDIEGLEEFAEFFTVPLDNVKKRIHEHREYEKELNNIFKGSRSRFEKQLGDNAVFEREKINFSSNLIDNIKRAFIYNSNSRLQFIYEEINDDTRKIFNNALESYLDYENEVPIVIYNNSTSKIDSEGFVITNKNIITHNDNMETIYINLEDVKSIGIDGNDILVNSVRLKTNRISSNDFAVFKCIFDYIILVIKNNKYLPEADDKVSDTLMLKEVYFNSNINCDYNELHDKLGHAFEVIEAKLKKNGLYNSHKVKLNKNIYDDLQVFSEKYSFNNLFFISKNINSKLITKLNNVYSSYASSKLQEEKEYFLFDNTVWGGAREGFYITNDYFYCHNSFEEPFKICISDIESIKVVDGKLNINGKAIDLIGVNDNDKYKLKNIIEYILIRLKYDNIINPKNERVELCMDKDIDNEVCCDNGANNNLFIPAVQNENELLKYFYDFILNKNTISIKNRLHINGTTAAANKRIVNASKSYLKIQVGEFVYALYDNTVFGSGKDGFVITNKNIYFHNAYQETVKVPFENIEHVSAEKACLVINRSKVDIHFIDNNEMELFKDILLEIIEVIKNISFGNE